MLQLYKNIELVDSPIVEQHFKMQFHNLLIQIQD